MNTFNTTLVSPAWAADSNLADDGGLFVHKSANLSDDAGIFAGLERVDELNELNEFTPGGPSICVSMGDIQIDIDRHTSAETVADARRIAAQLLAAADCLEAVK